jgi:mRNA interferase RelE/StbE
VPYTVEVAAAAFRDLGRLPAATRTRLHRATAKLRIEARPPGCQKLVGTLHGYRTRVGDFRVIYQVHDSQQLVKIGRILRRTETTYRRLP